MHFLKTIKDEDTLIHIYLDHLGRSCEDEMFIKYVPADTK